MLCVVQHCQVKLLIHDQSDLCAWSPSMPCSTDIDMDASAIIANFSRQFNSYPQHTSSIAWYKDYSTSVTWLQHHHPSYKQPLYHAPVQTHTRSWQEPPILC